MHNTCSCPRTPALPSHVLRAHTCETTEQDHARCSSAVSRVVAHVVFLAPGGDVALDPVACLLCVCTPRRLRRQSSAPPAPQAHAINVCIDCLQATRAIPSGAVCANGALRTELHTVALTTLWPAECATSDASAQGKGAARACTSSAMISTTSIGRPASVSRCRSSLGKLCHGLPHAVYKIRICD